MSTIEHTPTPWDPYPKTSVKFVELSIDDYRHAVRCVNVHEDLLEALESIQKWLSHLGSTQEAKRIGLLRQVRVALAKAKESN